MVFWIQTKSNQCSQNLDAKPECAQVCGFSSALLNAWCVSQTSGQNTACPTDMRVVSSVFKKKNPPNFGAYEKFCCCWWLFVLAFHFFKEKKPTKINKQMEETWKTFAVCPWLWVIPLPLWSLTTKLEVTGVYCWNCLFFDHFPCCVCSN